MSNYSCFMIDTKIQLNKDKANNSIKFEELLDNLYHEITKMYYIEKCEEVNYDKSTGIIHIHIRDDDGDYFLPTITNFINHLSKFVDFAQSIEIDNDGEIEVSIIGPTIESVTDKHVDLELDRIKNILNRIKNCLYSDQPEKFKHVMQKFMIEWM